MVICYFLFFYQYNWTQQTCDKHIHDVLNIFMLSGFTRDQGRYFVKPSPAKKGKEKTSYDFGIFLSLYDKGRK